MNDWEAYCDNGQAMVEDAHRLLFDEIGKIAFVNMRYKPYNNEQSAWFHDIDFSAREGQLVITFCNSDTPDVRVPLEEVAYIRLRPYYVARCVGFKNFIFHNKTSIGGML